MLRELAVMEVSRVFNYTEQQVCSWRDSFIILLLQQFVLVCIDGLFLICSQIFIQEVVMKMEKSMDTQFHVLRDITVFKTFITLFGTVLKQVLGK